MIPQLSNSDHPWIDGNSKTPTCGPISIPRCKVWRYKHADFDKGNELLCDMDLDNILNPYDTDELEAIQIYFPGCNGAVHTEVCASGEKQLTFGLPKRFYS